MKIAGIITLSLIILLTISCQKKDSKYLDAALNTEKWINSNKVELANGYKWVTPKPDSVALDTFWIYHGSSGVVLFYLELYNSTGNKDFLTKAEKGADYLISCFPEKESEPATAGFYVGWSGIGFTLNEVFKQTQIEKYRSSALKCIDFIGMTAQHNGLGIEWNGITDIINGSAGIGLFLLYANKEMGYPDALNMAKEIGNRLVEVSVSAGDGLNWFIEPEYSRRNFSMPNFAHGTAGVSYFLARLYEETKDQAFLEAAKKGANYLLSIANDDGMVFHHEPGGENLYYFGWCHGPAGTSRLFYKLYQITNDEKWLNPIRKSEEAILNSGIPDTLLPGFWNNVSQCCGSAGLAENYLNLYKTLKNETYLNFARKITDNLLKRSTTDGSGTRWVQAEHRTRPDLLLAQVGYMQGSAGIGMWLLHLDAYEKGLKPLITFPDVPFQGL